MKKRPAKNNTASNKTLKATRIALPRCAILTDEESGEETPVVVFNSTLDERAFHRLSLQPELNA
jgi:hypothetical protein